MDLFLCNNLVMQVMNEHYLGYILKDNGHFYNTLYQIIKKSSNEFLESHKLLQNGMIKLIYDVNEYRTYNSVAFHLSEAQYKNVVGSFMSTIKKVASKGFVQIETIDLDLNKIFINTEDCTVRLVCVPLNIYSTWETQSEFKQNAISLLAKMIYNSDSINIPSLFKLFSDCNSGNMMFDDIYNRMLTGYYGDYFFSDEMLNAENNSPAHLVLKSMTGENNIEITKSQFIIGKSNLNVDFSISNSKKISRKHCEIVYRENQFYIIDKESTNGTYVNNTRIPSGKLIPICTGDKIVLADLEYIVE